MGQHLPQVADLVARPVQDDHHQGRQVRRKGPQLVAQIPQALGAGGPDGDEAGRARIS